MTGALNNGVFGQVLNEVPNSLKPTRKRAAMNGAESLVRTLVAGGVDVCFTNPGTSEMHFVAALDRVDGMRCVLGLFEGVVTGAADGYYRTVALAVALPSAVAGVVVRRVQSFAVE